MLITPYKNIYNYSKYIFEQWKYTKMSIYQNGEWSATSHHRNFSGTDEEKDL